MVNYFVILENVEEKKETHVLHAFIEIPEKGDPRLKDHLAAFLAQPTATYQDLPSCVNTGAHLQTSKRCAESLRVCTGVVVFVQTFLQIFLFIFSCSEMDEKRN